MTREDIQYFLEGRDGVLSDQSLWESYAFSYSGYPLYDYMLGNEKLGRESSPSEILYYSGRNSQNPANHVNPQVLIVTLQKERGLIDQSYWGVELQERLDGACGYGCAEGGECEEEYLGFFNQAMSAARQMTQDFEALSEGVQAPMEIEGEWITPQNRATAVLYKYTPNFAGNELFYNLWVAYFGAPLERDDADLESAGPPNDDEHVLAGTSFTKSWTVKNTGNTTWVYDWSYLWKFDGGDRINAPEYVIPGETVAPGGSYTFSVYMVAPDDGGTYAGYWQMSHKGVDFGERSWVRVVVDEPTPTPTETPTETLPPTYTPTETPTMSPTSTPSGTPTETPTVTPTETPTPTSTPAPPVITNIARDEVTGDITISWTSSCNADIYYAVDMQSAFTLAESDVSRGSWTDDGALTGGHPNNASERYYKIACAGTSQYASDAVGMFRYSLAEGYNLICLPVIPYNSDIDVVFGTQLTEGSALTGDRLYAQYPDYGSAMQYGYLSSIYHEWKGTLDEASIVKEKGYFLQIKMGHTRLMQYVVGKVPSANVEMPQFVVGYNLIGDVWPVDLSFNASNLTESGANMGSPLTSDRVYSQAGSGYGGDLSYGWLSSSDGSWHGTLTGFRRGYGCWYKINGSKSPFGWMNLKPYSEPPY